MADKIVISPFARFADFYPFYLSQHSNRVCRRLHFAGTSLGLAAVLHAFSTLNFWWLLAGLAAGYALAWVGHFFFEKNLPALVHSELPWLTLLALVLAGFLLRFRPYERGVFLNTLWLFLIGVVGQG